ncbi:MAG: hypothetical protein AB8B75_22315 [Roseobacter sp.]
MTSDEKADNPKSKDPKDIERAEQLYRIADENFGGFADAEAASPKAPESNSAQQTVKVNDLETDPVAKDNSRSLPWILNVLEDLARFAEDQNCLELKDILLETQRKAAKLIGQIENK